MLHISFIYISLQLNSLIDTYSDKDHCCTTEFHRPDRHSQPHRFEAPGCYKVDFLLVVHRHTFCHTPPKVARATNYHQLKHEDGLTFRDHKGLTSETSYLMTHIINIFIIIALLPFYPLALFERFSCYTKDDEECCDVICMKNRETNCHYCRIF